MLIDFALEDNLDIRMVEGEIVSQENGETTMINAFFTDDRINEQRGYWLDVMSSEIWTYEQSRLTNEMARELTESAKEIAKELVDEGLYERIDAVAFVSDEVMTLHIRCYDAKGIVINRKFAI